MRKGIKKDMLRRNKKWKRFQQSKTFESEMEYKEIRNEVTSKIRQAKRSYEEMIAEKIKSDPRSFYSYMRKKSKVRAKIGPLKSMEGGMVREEEGMANMLNAYFASVFAKEDMDDLPEASKEAMGGKVMSMPEVE